MAVNKSRKRKRRRRRHTEAATRRRKRVAKKLIQKDWRSLSTNQFYDELVAIFKERGIEDFAFIFKDFSKDSNSKLNFRKWMGDGFWAEGIFEALRREAAEFNDSNRTNYLMGWGEESDDFNS